MHKNLIALVTVESREKAELFQSILETHGIMVFLAPNDKIRVLGEATISKQPFDVLVSKRDMDQALNVLQTRKTQAIPQADADLDLTVFTCRHCGERVLVKKSKRHTIRQCPSCLRDARGRPAP